MAIVGNLTVLVQAQTDTFAQGMRTVKAQLEQTQHAIRATQSSLGGLGAGFTGLLASALSIHALKNAVVDLAQTGIRLQGLQQTFALLTGSTVAGRQEFAFLVNTANQLGLGIVQLAESYRGFAAATRGTAVQGLEAREMFVTLTSASRTYGLSTEQTGRALLALQQIISKGKVGQDDLRQQLGEALPGASQIAARGYGITTQALDALITKGLDSIEFARKFTAQLKIEVPPATSMAGKGIAQLGNEIVLLKDTIAQGGLLATLDAVAAKIAAVMTSWREAGALQGTLTRRRATETLGPQGDLDRLQLADREHLLRITRNLELAEDRLQELRTGQQRDITGNWPGILGFGPAIQQETAAIERLRQQQTEAAATAQLHASGVLRAQAAISTLLELRPETVAARQAAAQQQQNLDKGRQILKALQEDYAKINREAALTPGLVDKNAESLAAAKKRAEELREIFQAQGTIPAEIRMGFQDIQAGAQTFQRNIETLAEQKAAAAQALQAMKAATAQAESILRDLEQLAEPIDITRPIDKKLAELGRLATELKRPELLARGELLALSIAQGEAGRAVLAFRAQEIQQATDFVRALEDEARALALTAEARTELRIRGLELTDGYEELGRQARRAAEQIEAAQSLQQRTDLRAGQLETITQIVEGLGQERDALASTTAALVQRRLALLGAGEATSRLAASIHQDTALVRVAGHAADLVTQSFIEMAATGTLALGNLQESLTRFVLSALADALQLRQTLTTVFQGILQGAVAGGQGGGGLGGILGGMLGGLFGASSGPDLAAPMATVGTGGTVNPLGTTVGGLQHGGYALPYRAYTVGERGPERLVMGATGGMVYPSTHTGPPVINMYISTPDIGNFRASERQLGRRAAAALTQALRGA